MNTEKLNLFIVDDNKLTVSSLRNYLNKKFGNDLNISTFYSGESVLKNVNENTNLVILDYFLGDSTGNTVLNSIKKINPKTEVIMLSKNEDVEVAIQAYRKGASKYIVKDGSAMRKISTYIYDILTYPIRYMVREWGFSKYFAIFIMTFITLGIITVVALNLMPNGFRLNPKG